MTVMVFEPAARGAFRPGELDRSVFHPYIFTT